MKPFQILGKFYPSEDAIFTEKYEHEYESSVNNPLRILLDIEENSRWSARAPSKNAFVAKENDGKANNGWHTDGGGDTGILLWSNMYPTEVKRGYRIYVGEPNDVILIDNRAVLHRVPLSYINAVKYSTQINRYFIRGILSEYPNPQEIAKWKKILGEVNK